ncbi:hypothetical protein IW261DRAFT_1425786 [Armillaria novae-zelandiae]|uniref:Uncharacterized protein n=1 Tax=Armillaria novae-zelandiae TaxID=153914 RepID=A0AA39U4R9_9AGAR|nr:hypothetical protein IW261DRAFT_1425786 [Armillaria novae-zelandiae]
MPPHPQPIPARIQHRRHNYYQNITPRTDKNRTAQKRWDHEQQVLNKAEYEDDNIYGGPVMFRPPVPGSQSSRKRAPSSGRRSATTGATTAPAPSPAWRKEKTPPPVEEAVVPIPAPQPSYPAAPPFIPVVLTLTSSMLRGTLAPMPGYTGALAGSSQDKGKQKEDRQSDVEIPYGELRTRARKLIQYQEWFLQGHTGVAYHDYREAGEYDYAQYIIDTKAEQHMAIQWNIYHPEQPVQVPAGWAPTMEPLRQTLPAQSMPPPFKMRGAKAKPGFTGRPFGGADNGAPGPAPADPDDPHPWGPVVN